MNWRESEEKDHDRAQEKDRHDEAMSKAKRANMIAFVSLLISIVAILITLFVKS